MVNRPLRDFMKRKKREPPFSLVGDEKKEEEEQSVGLPDRRKALIILGVHRDYVKKHSQLSTFTMVIIAWPHS